MFIVKIKKALASNGYPKKFVERAINKQIRRQGLKGNNKKQDDGIKSKTIARIPFIDGISQEVKRIMREANVECVFSNDSTLESLYCNKDPLPSEKQQNVVYAIKCRTCDEEYIGETRRALAVRVREHKDATRLDQSSKSAVAEHVHNHDIPHSIDWESVVVLDKARSKFNIERKMRESFHIHQRQPKMNRDQGIERSKTWNSVL